VDATALSSVRYADQRNINYSIAAAREWYAEHQKHYLSDGVSFFWNDEGETDYFTFHYWNVAQKLTLAKVDASARFYSINRAWSPGMARLGATVWTGDINPSWDDLRSTPNMILNWGLAGAPYVACDIGGFTGQSNGPLLTRWMQAGAFFPTMRVHSTHSATPHFPFLWPEPYASLMRAALNMRYQLLPYHYSLAHRMHQTGQLWVRPLAAAFPDDAALAEMTHQWLDGELLVAAVLSQDSSYSIYLPEGTWFRLGSTTTHEGPTTLNGTAAMSDVPVVARSGTIVPLAPVVQYSDALPGGALEVHVYGGADGSFSLVEDDGESYAYTSPGHTRTTTFAWDDAAGTLSWTVSGSATSVKNGFTQLSLSLYAKGEPVRTSSVVEIGDGGTVRPSSD